MGPDIPLFCCQMTLGDSKTDGQPWQEGNPSNLRRSCYYQPYPCYCPGIVDMGNKSSTLSRMIASLLITWSRTLHEMHSLTICIWPTHSLEWLPQVGEICSSQSYYTHIWDKQLQNHLRWLFIVFFPYHSCLSRVTLPPQPMVRLRPLYTIKYRCSPMYWTARILDTNLHKNTIKSHLKKGSAGLPKL